MPSMRRFSLGFTLIEVAVVLFIGGLILAGALQLSSALIENAHQRTTRENLQVIKVALQNYVGRTGRLPCPAVHTVTESGATFGTEAPTPGTCTGTVNLGGGTAKFGTVPWKSLGIAAAAAFDGWNNQFSYAVTTAATSTSFATIGVMRGVLTVHSDAPVSNGLPATGNQINACSTTANDNSCNLFAIVVIVSHGKNAGGAYTRTGAAAPLPTSVRELKNTIVATAPNTPKTDLAFVNSEYSEGTANYFDDIVSAMTPADVLAPLLAQGAIKFDEAALVEKFRQFLGTLTAYSVENRGGIPGSRTYPLPSTSSTIAYALNGSLFDGNCELGNPPTSIGFPSSPDMRLIRDPWGNEFRYQRAISQSNAGESCPTFAVFVSAGPDGAFNTTDDKIYYLAKGEFDAVISLSGW